MGVKKTRKKNYHITMKADRIVGTSKMSLIMHVFGIIVLSNDHLKVYYFIRLTRWRLLKWL